MMVLQMDVADVIFQPRAKTTAMTALTAPSADHSPRPKDLLIELFPGRLPTQLPPW
jgi:hypothetical protein